MAAGQAGMTLEAKKWLDYVVGTLLLLLLKPPCVLAGHILRRDHTCAPRGTILVIKMQGGGSLILAFRALQGLRDRYPGHRFLLLCTPSTRIYGEVTGVFDSFITVDDRSPGRLVASGLAALWRCRGVDTVIDLEVYSRLTSVMSLLTLARNRISFYLETTFWRRNLATHLLFFNRAGGTWLYYNHIARLLGAEPASRERCQARLREVLGLSGPSAAGGGIRRIGLGCFCSGFSRERMLSAAQWIEVLRPAFGAVPVEIVLLGGPADRSPAEELAAVLRQALPNAVVVNECGKGGLADSSRRLAELDAFWSIDSGLLHLARLLGLPTRSFWGPTDPATRLEALDPARETVDYRRLSCSPCTHVAEPPPCEGDNRCIQALFLPDPAEAGDPFWCVSPRPPAR